MQTLLIGVKMKNNLPTNSHLLTTDRIQKQEQCPSVEPLQLTAMSLTRLETNPSVMSNKSEEVNVSYL